jgi:hypothetical protein
MNANKRILALATILSVSAVGLKTTAATTTQSTAQKGSEYLMAALECSRALVNDPTGTPLNVRNTPNGKDVIGSYRNGAGVRIQEYSKDGKWAKVYPDSRVDKTPEGWVLVAYLRCPNRST